MGEKEAIPELDGEKRQQVAAGLWRAWWEQGRAAVVLTGFSGLGKTEQVVRPLMARAIRNGRAAVLIDVPTSPLDLDKQLTALLVQELNDSGENAFAERIANQPSFSVAVRELLRQGVLVVLDEFQRVLDLLNPKPIEPLATTLQRIATRPWDAGCLWLVSSRELDPTWTEPFYAELLEPPSDLNDLQRIVLSNIDTEDAEQRFPVERRLEVVRRLGANPRALRLLGNLLRIYPLEELFGPPGDVPEAPADPQFIEQIERSLLRKAEEGLSNAGGVLLRELTVLRAPAQWELVEAMGGHLGDVRLLSRELRERYLLEIRSNRYRLHPLVREVDGPRLRHDEVAWRAAHQRAGTWYGCRLHAENRTRIDEAKLAFHLAETQYHFTEAAALSELRNAMLGIREYMERSYGWSARNPSNEAERDSQIALLSLWLSTPGAAGNEYHLAKLLRERGAPGDLLAALQHAQLATANQDIDIPWNLWIRLVSDLEGAASAVAAAQTALLHVSPEKNIFSIYELLSGSLNRLGRTEESIEAIFKCVDGSPRREERLVSDATFIAAAEPSIYLLQRIRAWAHERHEYEPQVMVADVLLQQRNGEWRKAAETAQVGRKNYPGYFNLYALEALSWMGADEPQLAQKVLDDFRWEEDSWRPYSLAPWLAALVALQNGNLPNAARHLAMYLENSDFKTEIDIRNALLGEWDRAPRRAGLTSVFPILPSSVTGLGGNILRPKYGNPVLPQHRKDGLDFGPRAVPTLRILAIGGEWSSRHGGLSTFNRQLCRALAASGAQVACLVFDASLEDRREAGEVMLVEATHTTGQYERDWLMRKPNLPSDFTPDLIIGHGRVTGPAAKVLVEDDFPEAKRLHFVHIAPDEIEWFKLDREDDAGVRAEDRTRIELDLGRSAARVVAVGPRLYGRYLTELHPYNCAKPIELDPGFDSRTYDLREPPPGTPWRVLVVGRMEDYYLKGIDLAARAVGLAAERRQDGADPLELIVRGARPNTSSKLQDQLRTWSGNPSLNIVVRPFTTDTESLDADVKRASLVLMPSRKEGFGLVGLEAIVAGTPVLVSSESGLGELLWKTIGHEQASRIVVRTTGDPPTDQESWARAVEGVLRDREAAFHRAREVRDLLSTRKTWAGAIAHLLSELGEVIANTGNARS